MLNDMAVKAAADKAIEAHPEDRNISFSLNGKKYWIKRLMSNHRNQFAKYSPENQFLAEVARSTIAQFSSGISPKIVVLTPEYMVTESGGENLNWWMKSDATDEEKKHILYMAGAELGKLHNLGMTHGRPALRDFLYHDGKITLLDWENKKASKNLLKRKAIDYLLFIHSMLRESYAKEEFVKAQEEGYKSTAGTEAIKEARHLLKKYGPVGKLANALNRFHMKDIEAFARLYNYVMR